MNGDVTDDLTDDERRVCREALATLALNYQVTVRLHEESDWPDTPFRRFVERDLETARRLIRERFWPKGEGATA